MSPLTTVLSCHAITINFTINHMGGVVKYEEKKLDVTLIFCFEGTPFLKLFCTNSAYSL